MKKMLIMLALVLGVSAMAEEAATTTKAEDAKTGAMATMKKEAKKVEEKAKEVKEDVKKGDKAGVNNTGEFVKAATGTEIRGYYETTAKSGELAILVLEGII